MEKIVIHLNENDKKILKKESKKNINAKVREKALVVLLRNEGKTENEIKLRTGLAVTTILRHVKKYVENGIDSIYTTMHKGQLSELNKYKDLIIKDFKNTPPATIDEAIVRIEKLTNIKRTRTSIAHFLKKTNFLTKNQEVYQQKQTKKSNKNL